MHAPPPVWNQLALKNGQTYPAVPAPINRKHRKLGSQAGDSFPSKGGKPVSRVYRDGIIPCRLYTMALALGEAALELSF